MERVFLLLFTDLLDVILIIVNQIIVFFINFIIFGYAGTKKSPEHLKVFKKVKPNSRKVDLSCFQSSEGANCIILAYLLDGVVRILD
jgi:hypothetical protein